MQHIILLHGALGAKEQLVPLANELVKDHIVHCINFAGHGGETMPGEEFSISLFAQQILHYLDAKGIDTITIVGYSMGGFVALYLASRYPERITKVITLATKFQWDEQVSAREIKMLDPEKMKEKVPVFVELLQQRHTIQAWQMVLKKTAGLLWSLGQNNVLKAEDITAVKVPVLLLIGDRDKMVTLEETVTVFKQLVNGGLSVLPGTGHPIEDVSIKRLAFEIKEFMN